MAPRQLSSTTAPRSLMRCLYSKMPFVVLVVSMLLPAGRAEAISFHSLDEEAIGEALITSLVAPASLDQPLHGGWHLGAEAVYKPPDRLQVPLCAPEGSPCLMIVLVQRHDGFVGMAHTDHLDILYDDDGEAPPDLEALLASLAVLLHDDEGPDAVPFGQVADQVMASLDDAAETSLGEPSRVYQGTAVTVAFVVWLLVAVALLVGLRRWFLPRDLGTARPTGAKPLPRALVAVVLLVIVTGAGIHRVHLAMEAPRQNLEYPKATSFLPRDLVSIPTDQDLLHAPLYQSLLSLPGAVDERLTEVFPWYRLVAVALGLAAIVVVFAAARSWGGDEAGLAAALIIAASPHQATGAYVNESYTLGVLAVAGALWALGKLRAQGSPRAVWWCVVTAALTTWSTYPGTLVLPALFVALVLLVVPGHRARVALASLGVYLVLVAPVIVRVVLSLPEIAAVTGHGGEALAPGVEAYVAQHGVLAPTTDWQVVAFGSLPLLWLGGSWWWLGLVLSLPLWGVALARVVVERRPLVPLVTLAALVVTVLAGCFVYLRLENVLHLEVLAALLVVVPLASIPRARRRYGMWAYLGLAGLGQLVVAWALL